jgi:hypothetical protein
MESATAYRHCVVDVFTEHPLEDNPLRARYNAKLGTSAASKRRSSSAIAIPDPKARPLSETFGYRSRRTAHGTNHDSAW